MWPPSGRMQGAPGCREHMSSASCSQLVAGPVGFVSYPWVHGMGDFFYTWAEEQGGYSPSPYMHPSAFVSHRRNMIKKDNLVLGKEGSEFYISALVLI